MVSPITGQEIGIREIKVVKSKESIREMKVRVLSGLNLKVQADQVGQRGRYSVQTSYSQVLSSKYQVGFGLSRYLCILSLFRFKHAFFTVEN